MSSHLAIATVTATLQRTLQASVQMDVEGSRITTVRPSEIGKGTPETGVNIFMYQVISNPALHNIDATPFRSRGNPTKRQAALDLYYMVSVYGNDSELAPQRLLGSVVRTLNDRRVISRKMILDTCADSTFTFLRDADLADQLQQITIIPLNLTLEDLSKTWAVFFQTPYVLSVAYKVLVVLVEGEQSLVRALPVRDRRTGNLLPFPNRPLVDRIMSQAGVRAPILLNSTLLIRGEQLKGDPHTQIRVGGVEVTPAAVSPSEITLPLSDLPRQALRAGVQSLQVLHPIDPATPDQRGRRGAESNVVPFVLRPIVTQVQVSDLDIIEDEPRSGEITVRVNPPLGPRQHVVLNLNEWFAEAPSDFAPAGYMFDAPRSDEETESITIPFQEVNPGDYLIRLLIDGAESQLEVDDNPDSDTFERYIGPRVRID